MWIGKRIVWGVLHALACAVPQAPRMTVLLYHSISREKDFFAVTPEVFREHVQYFKRAGIELVPLSRAFEHAQGSTVTTDSVAITFDDGYKDFLLEVAPILAQESVPATVFVLGEDPLRSELANSLPLLSVEDITELAKHSLVSIGSHALSHRKLTKLSEEELKVEVEHSRERIQRAVGVAPAFLAYPKGAHNERVMRAVSEAGYRGAVSVIERGVHVGDDRLALPRVQVDSTTSASMLRAKVSVAADWYYVFWCFGKRIRG